MMCDESVMILSFSNLRFTYFIQGTSNKRRDALMFAQVVM